MATIRGPSDLQFEELRLPAELVEQLVDASDLGHVWGAALSGAGRIVGADGVRIAELTMRPAVSYRVLAQSADGPDLSAQLTRSPADHPIIAHYVQTRFEGWVGTGDLLPGRLWLEHPLYRDVYRPAGIRSQVSCALHDGGSAMLSLSLMRSRGDFSGRERERLRSLQWLIGAACRRALAEQRRRTAVQALEWAISDVGVVVVLSPHDGSVIQKSANLTAWSQSHPGALDDLLMSIRCGVEPKPIRMAGSILQAGVTRTGRGVVVSLSQAPSPGLTPREIEVLHHLAEGLTARAIAHRLGAAEATIRKHLEHIYAKLDVRDRVGAVTLAHRQRTTGQPSDVRIPPVGHSRNPPAAPPAFARRDDVAASRPT